MSFRALLGLNLDQIAQDHLYGICQLFDKVSPSCDVAPLTHFIDLDSRNALVNNRWVSIDPTSKVQWIILPEDTTESISLAEGMAKKVIEAINTHPQETHFIPKKGKKSLL